LETSNIDNRISRPEEKKVIYMTETQTWMTVPEAERYARVRAGALREAIERGELTAYRTGKRYLKVHRDDVDAWIRSHVYEPTF
jgi:excisionase family DNA binding protein